MTSSEFSNLFIELGFNIIKTSSLNWLIDDEGYAHSFPTLDLVYPTDDDFEEVFKRKVKFLLFRTNLEKCNTFEYLFEGNHYGLEQFDSKIRNQIKKGLKSCDIKDVDFDTLSKKGLMINRQTLKRQNRTIPYLVDSKLWEHYISKFYKWPDIYFKGAFVDNELAGYMLIIRVNDKYIIRHPFRDEKFSSSNPMNAILFKFINDIILQEGKIAITYGLASYSDKPGLDKFKKGMLFNEVSATRLAVISPIYKGFFKWPFRLLINTISSIKIIKSNKIDIYRYLSNANELYKKYY